MAGVSIQIQSINCVFNNGLISTAIVQYNYIGTWGDTANATHIWQLTPGEQTALAVTDFVTALINKLTTLTGLMVSTT